MATDLTAFISGGYFLTKRIARPKEITDLVPDTVITVSRCFTDIAPDTWADLGYNYEERERAEDASKFGIPSSAVNDLVHQFTEAVKPLHLTNFFPNLNVAQQFYDHCRNKVEVVLVGIGLHISLIPSFHAQLDDDVNHGYGMLERVDAKIPVAGGGEVLGYEPLGYDAMGFHSWLCHNVPVEANDRFGVRPNPTGFIDSFADAVRVTENLKSTGAETAIWEPWLILQYHSVSNSGRESPPS